MRILTVVLFALSTIGALAQIDDSEIDFESEVYDFGTIKFGDQKINATYIFTNNSPIDFVIRDVKASCGCTVPSWPEHPIKPGQKGIITATFDPTNLAGEVDKNIEIFANYNVIMSKILTIAGTISEPIQQDLSKVYPGQYGYLRQSKNTIALGQITNSQTFTDKVVFINDYNLPLKFDGILRSPEYVTYSLSKTVVQPGDTASVTITVHADKVGDYGLINSDIVFKTNDKSFPLKAVKLAFFLTEDFSKLKKSELKKAPKLIVSQTEFDFGTMREGAVSTKRLELKNTGKTALKIYKVVTHCGCTTVDIEAAEIGPGESRTVELSFDSIFVSGLAQKEVTFFTNDPSLHIVTLYVKAEVLSN
ncbi:MAG: hypothetical protein ACI9JN_001761 [Bacteroidia bacterium]|jgi:hypothetical protein